MFKLGYPSGFVTSMHSKRAHMSDVRHEWLLSSELPDVEALLDSHFSWFNARANTILGGAIAHEALPWRRLCMKSWTLIGAPV